MLAMAMRYAVVKYVTLSKQLRSSAMAPCIVVRREILDVCRKIKVAIHRDNDTPFSVDNAGFAIGGVSFRTVAAWVFSEATGWGSRKVRSFDREVRSLDVRPMLQGCYLSRCLNWASV